MLAENIASVDFSLRKEKRGHTCVNITTGEVTIFLSTLSHELTAFFGTIEDFVEEQIIHELLHLITGIGEDKYIDFWHNLICRIDSIENNPGIAQFKDCSCPIVCFWRDMYLQPEA